MLCINASSVPFLLGDYSFKPAEQVWADICNHHQTILPQKYILPLPSSITEQQKKVDKLLANTDINQLKSAPPEAKTLQISTTDAEGNEHRTTISRDDVQGYIARQTGMTHERKAIKRKYGGVKCIPFKTCTIQADTFVIHLQGRADDWEESSRIVTEIKRRSKPDGPLDPHEYDKVQLKVYMRLYRAQFGVLDITAGKNRKKHTFKMDFKDWKKLEAALVARCKYFLEHPPDQGQAC
jgi:hypothetical protein